MGRPQEPCSPVDCGGIRHHVRKQFPVNLIVEDINLIVPDGHATGQSFVTFDERGDGIAQHLAGDQAHPGDVDQWLEQRFVRRLHHDLGDA